MMRRMKTLSLILLSTCFMTSLKAHAGMPPFRHTPTDTAMGFYRETLLAADIDKDGDMDFFSGEGRGGKLFWFEKRAQGWHRHLASDTNVNDVGAAVFDIDGDGWVDRIASGYWYRNPGFANRDSTKTPAVFGVCRYSDQQYLHDVYSADMDKDGRIDVITINYDGIRWFRNPPADSVCGLWEANQVNGQTLDPQQHGGIAIGDLDGDGDLDISRLDRWFENSDSLGKTWVEHKNIDFGNYDPGSWGLSGRAMIVDMNGDGKMDIVQTECDLPNGRVAWFENSDGKGKNWKTHTIKDSTEGQDFHSLIVVDFDKDGDLDVFSAGAGHSVGAPKAYIWENRDGKGEDWFEHVILTGEYRIHDAGFADLDGDGDIDVLAKNFDVGAHYYLANQSVPNALGPRKGVKAGRNSQPFRFIVSPLHPLSGPTPTVQRGGANPGRSYHIDGRCFRPLPSRP